MKKKWLAILIITLLLGTLLTACGGTEGLQKDAESALAAGDVDKAIEAYNEWIQADPASEVAVRGLAAAYAKQPESDENLQHQIQCYEMLYGFGTYTQEDFMAAAALYEKAGQTKQQRNVLETRQRMSYSDEIQNMLNTLVVDAATEEDDILGQLTGLAQLLASEDANGAVALTASAEFNSTVLPNIAYGMRQYRLATENGDTLVAKISYSNSQYACQAWLLKADGKLVQLEISPARILYYTVADGKTGFNGAFELQLLDAATGDMFMESGTFTASVCTGDITSNVAWGEEPITDLTAAWPTRGDLDFTEYTGEFDETGHTKVTQQKTEDGSIVYASVKYSGKLYYLTLKPNVEADAENFIFTAEAMGLTGVPSFA